MEAIITQSLKDVSFDSGPENSIIKSFATAGWMNTDHYKGLHDVHVLQKPQRTAIKRKPPMQKINQTQSPTVYF